MSSIAYALRAEYADSYGGGNVNIGGSPFDVEEALQAGNGQILVDEADAPALTVFDSYAPLERVAVKKKTPTTKKPAKADRSAA